MACTGSLFAFAILIMSAALYLPLSASIKQEIPDLNIPLGIEEDIRGLRPKTSRDRHLQALMKIQKKKRGTASQSMRPITERERKLQSMMRVQKMARMLSEASEAAKSSSGPSFSNIEPQPRIRAKTKPQYPSPSMARNYLGLKTDDGNEIAQLCFSKVYTDAASQSLKTALVLSIPIQNYQNAMSSDFVYKTSLCVRVKWGESFFSVRIGEAKWARVLVRARLCTDTVDWKISIMPVVLSSVMSLPSSKKKPSAISPPPKDFDINEMIDHASSPAGGSHTSGSYSSSTQGTSQTQQAGSSNSRSSITRQRISDYRQHRKAQEMGYDRPPSKDWNAYH
ncbi:uncharacterized protein FA14DRAFT_155902 [Meira miltonrushii]|uniref:Uncharacterized protein n=1 Tax=Meira miltonrushii TaxID=1280837 RepID=A0A316V6Z5_9BASI|nr:uncharacterized protein FA14DRAFT_155902 [Meira miltonrushii]PWN33202.1 hypothetical protein FA14DRAFT_155902 [Meira miltonrushii]